MSGGSLDYVYYKVEECGREILRQANTPSIKAFGLYMLKLSKAIHDVEWYLSGDISVEEAEKSIKEVMGDEWKNMEIFYLNEEAKRLIQHLQKLIEE